MGADGTQMGADGTQMDADGTQMDAEGLAANSRKPARFPTASYTNVPRVAPVLRS
jgi:hypothetical protein